MAMFEPSPKLVRWARRLAPYADKWWVTWFFAFFFFIDSYLMLIPIDGLMVITLVFVPHKVKKWFFAGLMGATLGYISLAFLTQSSFQHFLLSLIQDSGYMSTYQGMVFSLSQRGYVYLLLLTFTFMPQNICLVGSILVGLKPTLVLFILVASKLFKMSWMFYAALRFKDMILGMHEKWKEKNLKKSEPLGS